MGGQLLANVLLPIFVFGVLQWDYTAGALLPEFIIEDLNSRTQSTWDSLWELEGVPTDDCTTDAQQLHTIVCNNDKHKAPPTESRKRRSANRLHKRSQSVFLNLFEAHNFLGKTKRTHSRVRRTTTFSTECCDKVCVWEEVGEYCWHIRVYH